MKNKFNFLQLEFWSNRQDNPLIISFVSTVGSLIFWSIISLLFFRDKDTFTIGVFATIVISFSVSYFIALKSIEYVNLLEEERIKNRVEQQRVAILATFIQKAAHEFRTPLTIIMNATYLIPRIEEKEKQEQKFQQIVSSVKTINQLVDNMLQLTQLETMNESVYELRPIDELNSLIDNLKINFNETIQNKQISLTVELAPHLPRFYCNEEDILFTLQEILTNAAQSINKTGTIHMSVQQEDAWIKIQIQDDGEGMEDTVFEHIFEPFYRKDESHTSSGMGLGLPISKRIIELHQGSIQVDSEFGIGTCVTLLLPISNVNNESNVKLNHI